jgi:hypothetical protein
MKNQRQYFPRIIRPAVRTAFHSLLLTTSVLLLVFGGLRLWQPASLAANPASQNKQDCKHCSPPADQIIYLPLLDLPEARSSELVFNSRSPKEMEVTPTFYKLDGTAVSGKAVRVKPTEIRYVDLKQLIPGKYHNDQDWGGLTLAYYGVTREMWAQLRLLGINGGGSADEFFTVPAEHRASVQEAVWWTPHHSTSILALGNITDVATGATVQFGDEPAQSVNLAPHATHIIRRTHSERTSVESMLIKVNGPTGSVVPTGVITAADGSFNAVIRFYDTQHTKQPHLFANGARLADVTPHLVLKNTTSAAIVATPKFIPLAGSTADGTVSLPAVNLAPYQAVELDLRTFAQAAQRRADLATVSIQVTNNGAPGSLIGALYSQHQTTGVNYEVPLRDSGPPRSMTGAYPWQVRDDFTTIVYLTNISDGPAHFVAQINYDGGFYVIAPRKLAAGETAVYDMRKLIAEQQPDSTNRRLPKDLQIGQFKWVMYGTTGGKVALNGRAEMVNQSKRISTSYSCAENCIASYRGIITPSDPFVFAESVDVMTLTEKAYFNDGSTMGPWPATGTWSSDDTNIVTMSGTTCTAVAPGQTGVHAFIGTYDIYTWDGLDCLFSGTMDSTGDTTVTVKPSITRLEPARGLIGQTHSVAIVGTGFEDPAGVTVGGSGITANVQNVAPNGRSIIVDFVVAANATPGNHAVTVTVNGQTSNSVNFFVQIPTKLVRFDYTPAPPARQAPNGISQLYTITNGDILDLSGDAVSSNRCGAYRNLMYRLLDQDGDPIEGVEVSITETFPANEYSGPSGFKPNDLTRSTSDQGLLEDLNSLTTSAGSCLTANPSIDMKQHFFATVGQTQYNLTTVVRIQMGYNPTTNTYNIDNSIFTQ